MLALPRALLLLAPKPPKPPKPPKQVGSCNCGRRVRRGGCAARPHVFGVLRSAFAPSIRFPNLKYHTRELGCVFCDNILVVSEFKYPGVVHAKTRYASHGIGNFQGQLDNVTGQLEDRRDGAK